MIILDTNVVAVAMGASLDDTAAAWFEEQDAGSIYITAVTRAEVRYGIARLPSGRRRRALQRAADTFFTGQSGRTLPFDATAADAYGKIVADRERRGRPIGIADAQIAAIARAHGADIATRDMSGFELTGVSVVNPFS